MRNVVTSAQSSQGEIAGKSRRSPKVLYGLLAGLVVAIVWFLPLVGHWLHSLERRMDDLLCRVDHGPVRDDFIFLGMDEASTSLGADGDSEVLQNESIKMMQGTRDWSRAVHARAIERLMEGGAKLVVMDVVFKQPSLDPLADAELASVIAKYHHRIVLAGSFDQVPGQGTAFTWIDPYTELLDPEYQVANVGFVNLWPHPDDNIVRTLEYQITHSEVNGQTPHPDDPPIPSLPGAAAEKLGLDLPSGPKDPRWGPPNAYPVVSYYKIFLEDEVDVKDKIVIIGPAAAIYQDIHNTPVGRVYGPRIHLHALAALLEDSFYKRLDGFGWRMVFLLLGVLAALALVILIERPLRLLAAGVGLLFLFCAFAAIAAASGLLIPLLPALAGVAAVLVTSLTVLAVNERIQREQLRQHLRRSLSPEVADAIIASPEGYLGAAQGGKKMVAILFSDIRGFTKLAEEMSPTELVDQLNEYFGEMTAAVFDHGGTIDKFIGDAVMASWGGLGESDPQTCARSAIASAEEMLSRLDQLNEKWRSESRPEFEIGIGVHLGEAVAGEIGSEVRSEFTVLGDAVNLASRMESFTKQIGYLLVISDAVEKHLENPTPYLGHFRLKGKTQTTKLYVPGSVLPDEFVKALEKIDSDQESALAEISNIDSPLAKLYRELYTDGAVNLTSK